MFPVHKDGELINDGFPEIWNLEFISVHNCCIASSVTISRNVFDQAGEFNTAWDADYNFWKKALRYTDCAYVREPCFYYDQGHGDGKKY